MRLLGFWALGWDSKWTMTSTESTPRGTDDEQKSPRQVRHALRRSLPFLVGVGVLALALNVAFSFIHPEQLVALVGVENVYGAVFLVGVIGGLSSATGPVLVLTIATFAAGGANPLLLGVAAGAGLFISDSLFFLAFSLGRRALSPALQSRADALRSWIASHPPSLVVVITFAYLALTPLPNDIVTSSFGFAGYRYRWIAPILFISALVYAIGIAYGSALLWGA